MPRVKRGVTTGARHKKILSRAKGYYNARRKTIKIAKQAVDKAAQYAFRDRRARKRDFRSLWIVRINAAARECGMSYSRFMDGLKQAAVGIDRKVLADIAVNDRQAFAALADKAKAALAS
jgi:large subunit ribosomal protein L20